MRGRQFKNRFDAYNQSKSSHMCTSCMFVREHSWNNGECPRCKKTGTRQYFKSAIEQQRAAELIIALMAGQITNLRFQPRYDLVVDGVKITTYVADSEYRENGKVIIEDVKPEKYMDGEAKLKIKLFDAINAKHNLSVTLHRKGG